MSREIELIFPKRNLRLTAKLLEEQAPKTCDAVWSVLSSDETLDSVKDWPEGGLVHHGRYVGPELYTFIPPAKLELPPENVTYRPIPGDILLVIVPAQGARYVAVGGELWDFVIIYDRNACLKVDFAPGVEETGWIGNRFAKILNEQLDLLLDLGNKIWLEGAERVIIRRKE